MPAQAQRMSSLLASDKEFAFCRELKGESIRFIRCGASYRCRKAGGGGKQRAGQGSTADTGRHGEERTSNIANMLVTLEVLKLSG